VGLQLTLPSRRRNILLLTNREYVVDIAPRQREPRAASTTSLRKLTLLLKLLVSCRRGTHTCFKCGTCCQRKS